MPLKRAHIFRKSRSHRKTLGARRAARSNFRTKKRQTLGATVQNLVV